MKHTYVLRLLLGEFLMTPDQGTTLYNLIYPELIEGHEIELDFMGVTICIPPFINYSIGLVLKDIELEELNSLLIITNLEPVGRETLRLAMESSNEYWRDSRVKQAVDEVITRLSIEGLRS